ncbi:MAG TPA: hypothetical protein VH186_17490 [Chloroflexia bacterium]|nr:hypothetical protein [Chloroflexia bacterium]
MASNLLSTCPICGYTDTADDPTALNDAIEEHIRLAHNLNPATLNTAAEVKPNQHVDDETNGDIDNPDEREATNLENATARAYGLGVLGRGPGGSGMSS